jgi:hypothetical protein
MSFEARGKRSIARRNPSLGATVAVLALLGGCAHPTLSLEPRPPFERLTKAARREEIGRAQVWTATDVSKMDLRAGPPGKNALAPAQAVACDYVEKRLGGTSPKFACGLSEGDVAKVKYGAENGEVFGSVLSSRLFWALGFGVDAYYPVRVTCRGCPADPWKGPPAAVPGEVVFDLSVIERKMPGKTLESKPDEGWKWSELDLVDEARGGAPRAQRDALTLLAAVVQHMDNKAVQQRLICLPGGRDVEDPGRCERPFLLVHDLGVTFGSAGFFSFHLNRVGAANFKNWSAESVWKNSTSCLANIPRTYQGTLSHPRIHEAGRKFLADLLEQLSSQQLHDLFAVARVDQRSRHPGTDEPPASVDEWVRVFERKRDEITSRRCAE